MDMQHNENRLVPGQGRPLSLDKVKQLTARRPVAAAEPSWTAVPPRRRKRDWGAWAGAVALGTLVSAACGLFLSRGGLPDRLVRASERPTLPDAGLAPGEKQRYWDLAALEPSPFPALLGVRADGPARLQQDPERLERLLSD